MMVPAVALITMASTAFAAGGLDVETSRLEDVADWLFYKLLVGLGIGAACYMFFNVVMVAMGKRSEKDACKRVGCSWAAVIAVVCGARLLFQ